MKRRGENAAVEYSTECRQFEGSVVSLWNLTNERKDQKHPKIFRKNIGKKKREPMKPNPSLKRRKGLQAVMRDQLRKTFHECEKHMEKMSTEERMKRWEDFFVMTFQIRDCRKKNSGKGLRFSAWKIFSLLSRRFPKTCVALLPMFVEFGYWKDLNELLKRFKDHPFESSKIVSEGIVDLYASKLKEDLEVLEAKENMGGGKPVNISLAAKWVPKFNKHFDRLTSCSTDISAALYGTKSRRKFGKDISRLNEALRTTERLMCAQRWAEIRFESVPGRCLNRHRRNFIENERTKERMLKFIMDLKDRKVKGGAKGMSMLPSDLVEHMFKTSDKDEIILLETQFNDHLVNMKEAMEETKRGLGCGIVLADVSGSMEGKPMNLAIALSLIVSSLAEGVWRNKFITFESNPHMLDHGHIESVADKARFVRSSPWGGSTDFLAAMQLILDTAVKKNLTQAELPEWLMVVSDMQFNMANGSRHGLREEQNDCWDTHHQILVDRFANAGMKAIGTPYTPPTIIYWNARGDVKGFPVSYDQKGTVMVSGYSSTLLKLFLNDGDFSAMPTPYAAYEKALAADCYEIIRKKVQEVGEVEMYESKRSKENEKSENKEESNEKNIINKQCDEVTVL